MKSTMITTIYILIFILCLNVSLYAQVYTKVFQASSAGTGLITYSYPHFTSEKCGYAQTSDKRIVKTTNGGDTWFLLNTPATLHSNFRFVSDSIGFLIEPRYDEQLLKVFKTINGGITWSFVGDIVKEFNYSWSSMNSTKSDKINIGNYYLKSFTPSSLNYLFKLDVENNYFNEITLPDTIRNNFRVGQFYPFNSDTLFIVIDSKLYCLSDGWTKLTVNPLFDSIKGYINDVYLQPDGTLVLIGNPYSYISKDAGKTWSIEEDSSLSGRMIRGIGNNIIFNNLESYNVANCYFSNNLGDSVIKMDSSFRELLWTGEYTDFVFRDSVTAFFFANSFNCKAIIKVDFSKNVSSIDDNQKESELKTRISFEVVTIESTFPILSVDCYSLLGNKLTTTMALSENTATVVKSSLPNGVYYLHVQTTRGMEVVPFMNVR